MGTHASPRIGRREHSVRHLVRPLRTTSGRQSLRLAFLCVATALGFFAFTRTPLVDHLAAGTSLVGVTAVVVARLVLVVGAAAMAIGAMGQALLAVVDERERSLLLALPVAVGAVVATVMIAQLVFPS